MNAPPGILPTGTKFDSYIGQNVINLSKVALTEHQVTALEKGLTFCPTPGAPDKSQIWDDFKEFHRRLELMQFFNPGLMLLTHKSVRASLTLGMRMRKNMIMILQLIVLIHIRK